MRDFSTERFGDDPYALDDSVVDQLLDGADVEMVPPRYQSLAEILAAVRGAATDDELAGELEAVALFRAAQPAGARTGRSRRRRARSHKALLATGVLIAGTAGGVAAATGRLPDIAQDLASALLSKFGVHVPGADDGSSADRAEGWELDANSEAVSIGIATGDPSWSRPAPLAPADSTDGAPTGSSSVRSRAPDPSPRAEPDWPSPNGRKSTPAPDPTPRRRTDPRRDPPSGPPADPPSGPPADPPSDPPADPPDGPTANPPSGPPADPPGEPPSDPPGRPPAPPPTGPPSPPPGKPPAPPPTGPPSPPPSGPPSPPPTGPPSPPPTGPPSPPPGKPPAPGPPAPP